MMKPMNLKKELPYLKPALQRIAKFILDNPEKCRDINIKELAIACEVAESTVTRFTRELGFGSFRNFKTSLIETLSLQKNSEPAADVPQAIYEGITPNDTLPDIIEKIYHRNNEFLAECKESLNIKAVESAAELIMQSDKLLFTSMGFSSLASDEAMLRFTRVGKVCLHCKDYSLQLMLSSIVTPDDVVIAISDTGRTEAILETVRLARGNKAKVIAITSDSESPVAKLADVLLLTPKAKQSREGAFRWESVTSKFAQLMIVDILYSWFAIKNYENSLINLEKTYRAIKNTRNEP